MAFDESKPFLTKMSKKTQSLLSTAKSLTAQEGIGTMPAPQIIRFLAVLLDEC